MSNLNDEDMEILTNMQGFLSSCEVCSNDCDKNPCKDLKAINNMLKELEELETYKKIVGEIIEETANGMKYLYVDTSVKDEGKYEAYMDIRNVLEKYKIID